MRKTARSQEALFRFRGVPPLGMAVSMALQHLVAMIVGCVLIAMATAAVFYYFIDNKLLGLLCVLLFCVPDHSCLYDNFLFVPAYSPMWNEYDIPHFPSHTSYLLQLSLRMCFSVLQCYFPLRIL